MTEQRTLSFLRLDYRAADPPRLEHFYRNVLGVEAELTFERTKVPRDDASAGLFHTAFLYPDRRSLAIGFLRLAALGFDVQGASDHGVSEAIYLEDPEGNGVEIYCDRPSARWPRRDGEITMGTYRLAIDDLLAQAPADARDAIAEIQSSGPVKVAPSSLDAPGGIIVGHVHLRARDMDASEAFWRERVGLDVTMRYGATACFLSDGGYHHHIAFNRFSQWRPPVDGGPGLAALTIARSADSERLDARSPEGIDVRIGGATT